MPSKNQKIPETRFEYLDRAALTVADRGDQYGSVAENFERTADIWSAILGTQVTAQQVALCLIGLKVARLTYDPDAVDGWIDVAGYAACGGEVSNQNE
tara:strand:+ start:1629 stop:1922 length:294 start_codon:yes stop_codon:yes gene_type:complete